MEEKEKKHIGLSLTIKDRLVASRLYPKESDIITQIMVSDITKKVEFTQENIENLEMRLTETGSIKWNQEKAKKLKIDAVEIEFTGAEIEFLKSRVNELDGQRRVGKDMLDLCLKIREG